MKWKFIEPLLWIFLKGEWLCFAALSQQAPPHGVFRAAVLVFVEADCKLSVLSVRCQKPLLLIFLLVCVVAVSAVFACPLQVAFHKRIGHKFAWGILYDFSNLVGDDR